MISVEHLNVELGDFTLHDINLKIDGGEYFVVLGPTGAGKTVLLESIAGLNPIKSGAIRLKDSDITNMKPEKRGVSIVYQEHALFPHLTVRDNILFGLRLRKKTAAELSAAQDWLVDLLDISHLIDRKPDTLSGGERQKVALARALSTRPAVLLLDEPLSALDPETREAVQEELRKLHRILGNTIIHVTHDFEEAITLADRIAVIGHGSIQQIGTPEQIFRHPTSEFVARFAMVRNIYRGEVTVDGTGEATFEVEGTRFAVVTGESGSRRASIRPEDIILSHAPFSSSARNALAGIITDTVDKGSTMLITVRVPPVFVCLVTRTSFDAMDLSIGRQVYITFKASAVNIF